MMQARDKLAHPEGLKVSPLDLHVVLKALSPKPALLIYLQMSQFIQHVMQLLNLFFVYKDFIFGSALPSATRKFHGCHNVTFHWTKEVCVRLLLFPLGKPQATL